MRALQTTSRGCCGCHGCRRCTPDTDYDADYMIDGCVSMAKRRGRCDACCEAVVARIGVLCESIATHERGRSTERAVCVTELRAWGDKQENSTWATATAHSGADELASRPRA